MFWFSVTSALRDRGRGALLAVGLAVAVASTGLLLGSVSTAEVRVAGSLRHDFRPAYDIVVRPKRSVTSLERRDGLVRETYLSDLFGGISLSQLAAIRSIPGIAVAPIENLGYVLAEDTVLFPFHPPRRGPNEQLFRLSARFSWPGGGSGWGSAYVYVDRRAAFRAPTPAEVYQPVSGHRKAIAVCGPQSTPPGAASRQASPFTAGHLEGSITCFSEASPDSGSYLRGQVVVSVSFPFPLLLEAIDPRVENRFFGLGRAMVSGRYLRQGEGAKRVAGTNLGPVMSLPVIASTTTALDEELILTTTRIAASNGPSLPLLLSSKAASQQVERLSGSPRRVAVEHASALYLSLLHRAELAGRASPLLPVPEYWVAGSARTSAGASNRRAVSVRRVAEPPGIWRAPAGWGAGQSFASGREVQLVSSPPGSSSSGYRALSVRTWAGGKSPVAALDVVGEFDPRLLRRFAAASRVPLETFTAPLPRAANAATRTLIAGRVLRANTDLGSYLSSPPELLTTLEAARALLGSSRYTGSAATASHPIGAVLIRLNGRLGYGAGARRRLEAVASAIRWRTGLSVQVTDGSSPTPVAVRLEHFRGGRAAELEEAWTELGVSESLGRSLDAVSAGLVLLTSLAGILFVAEVTASLTRRRRRELAILASVGWRRPEIARLILSEVAAFGLAGSLLGGILALWIHSGAALRGSETGIGAAVAVGPLVALVAGSLPTLSGTRHLAAASERAAGRRAGRRTRASRAGLALVAAASSPGRALLAASPVAIAVAATGLFVSIQHDLSGRLLATNSLLGSLVGLQAKSLDTFVLVVLGSLGLASVANTVAARHQERAETQRTLRLLGWQAGDLARLLATEALVLTGLGGATGLGLAIATSTALSLPLGQAVQASLWTTGLELAGVSLTVALPALFSLRRAESARETEAEGTARA